MKKLLLLIIAVLSYSFSMNAEYVAKYGFLGKVAKADGYFEKNETNYIIKTHTKLLGIVGSLSKHLQMDYISIGKIRNNLLYPQKYITIRKNSKKEIKTVYVFKKNKILKLRYKNGKLETNSTVKYYTTQDVLSLYFNLPKLIKNYNKTYTFYALGGRHKDGKIEVSFPKGKELKKLKEEFDNEKGIYLKANLYNKVFSGDKGILYLVINPNNWVTLRGMVKNVLKIGDLKGRLVKFTQAP